MKQAISEAPYTFRKKDFSLLRVFTAHPILWVWVYFTALAVLMTWPLALRMGDSIVGSIGDNIYFVWMIGWVKRALFDLHTNPFNVWFLNYPEGWSLAYTEITPAQLLLAVPFSLLGGPTFGYNAALLLTFILSGVSMFLWVRHLTGRWEASLVAGTIFAFLPYRFAHFLIGHLNLTGTQWFPIYFWGFCDLLQAREFRWKPALLAGVGLGLIALTSQYYLYMSLLISAFMAFVYLIFLNRKQLTSRSFWKGVGAAVLAALPLVGVAVAPFVLLAQQGGLPDRNLGIVRMYSASPTDFFLPSTDHFLWGRWIGTHFNRDVWVEGTLYIGAVALVLALIAWWRRKQSGQAHLMLMLLWGAALAFLLAMGTDFHWLSQPVTLTLPEFLARLLHRSGEVPLALPGYFLFLHFPFYAKLRAFMRFGIFVLVFSSAAAGLGTAWLLKEKVGHKAALLTALLLALVILDFYPGPYTTFAKVEARPVDAWLANQPGKGALVQFPFSEEEDQEQTYYTLFHGKPYVGGFFNAFPPVQYARIKPEMAGFPDEKSAVLLKQLGVQYVLVDTKQYPDMKDVRLKCEGLGMQYVTQQGDEAVFEMK